MVINEDNKIVKKELIINNLIPQEKNKLVKKTKNSNKIICQKTRQIQLRIILFDYNRGIVAAKTKSIA